LLVFFFSLPSPDAVRPEVLSVVRKIRILYIYTKIWMVPCRPGTGPGTTARQRKQQGRVGEGQGREGREEGKERGREGVGMRRGKERVGGADGIDGQRREQEIDRREGGRAGELS
jgi:hypothetical protein